jgi:hypothetical protein
VADLVLNTVAKGLNIVSDVSDFTIDQFSTKINNLNNVNRNELIIVGRIKDNYTEYTINFDHWDNVTFNGVIYTTDRTLQDELDKISIGQNLLIHGQNPGTFFGDDIRTTRRIAVSSAKYSQGLPVAFADYDIVGTGYWELPLVGGVRNGVSEFGTGTDANGKIYLRSKGLNRYEPGQLSYFVFTTLFGGIEDANGDFVALIGANVGGLEVDGQYGDIKEGYMFGWKRVSGVLSPIFRVYKNFGYTEYSLDNLTLADSENLKIYFLEVGYLGIHPALLYRFDTKGLKYDLLKKLEFNQDITSVNDPNMSIGVYLENSGNTTNITIRNGSFQYGNYAERETFDDASSRDILDEVYRATVTAGTDVFIAAYRIPQKVDMISRLDGTTGITQSEFRNTIFNRLKRVQLNSSTNRVYTVSFYFIPSADITGASWQILRANINLLERTDVGTVNLANADVFERFIMPTATSLVVEKDVRDENYQLGGDNVAVITATSQGGTNITDFNLLINTEDLF